METKEFVEKNLKEIATLIVAITAHIDCLEKALNHFSGAIESCSNVQVSSDRVADSFSGERLPLIERARKYVDFGISHANIPQQSGKEIMLAFNQAKLKEDILEPIGSKNQNINYPLTNLFRTRIAVSGKRSLYANRDKIAQAVLPEMRDKFMYLYDMLLETSSKINLIELFGDKFVTLNHFGGSLGEDGRYYAQEREWRDYCGEGSTREYDPDWYGTNRTVVF